VSPDTRDPVSNSTGSNNSYSPTTMDARSEQRAAIPVSKKSGHPLVWLAQSPIASNETFNGRPVLGMPLKIIHLRILIMSPLSQKLCKDPEMQAQCGQVAQGLLVAISHRVLRILIRHLRAITSALTGTPYEQLFSCSLSLELIVAPDIPFVFREVVQSLLPGSPQDLADEAQALSDILTTSFATHPGVTGLHELCPACHTDVPLQDVTRAICPNGHTWGGCFSSPLSLRS